MKPKHTPGPWKNWDNDIISNSGYNIAHVNPPSRQTSGTNSGSSAKREKQEANANLIAAAPEMQAALLDVIMVYQQPQYGKTLYEVLIQANQALRKSGFFKTSDKELKAFMEAHREKCATKRPNRV